MTQFGVVCPEQWRGSVAGRSFYFRERHDLGRIELDLRPSGHVYQAYVAGDIDDESSYETRDVEEGDVIAEHTTADDRYGRDPVERAEFIVDHIRVHIARAACATHTSGRDDLERRLGQPPWWCPGCGTRLTA